MEGDQSPEPGLARSLVLAPGSATRPAFRKARRPPKEHAERANRATAAGLQVVRAGAQGKKTARPEEKRQAWAAVRRKISEEEGGRRRQKRGQASSARRLAHRRENRVRGLVHVVSWVASRGGRLLRLQALVAQWKLNKIGGVARRAPIEMQDGHRSNVVTAGFERWECEGCSGEFLTQGWKWRWCAQCIEGTFRRQQATEQSGAQLEQLQVDISEAQRVLTMVQAAVDETAMLLEEHGRQEEVRYHRELIDEMKSEGAEVVRGLDDMKIKRSKLAKKLKKDSKELQEIQRQIGKAKPDRTELVLQKAGQVGAWADFEDGMRAATEGVASLQMREVRNGVVVCSYKDAKVTDFDPEAGAVGGGDGAEDIFISLMRRECRGLVLERGKVAAQPLHRFFSVGQVADAAMPRLSEQRIMEATVKLDGIMAFGVVVDGGIEFWTKGGNTEVAKVITRWAVHSGSLGAGVCGALRADYMGLVAAVEAMGSTAIFEWVGPQAKIRVKEEETGLILLQVRDKANGEYWGYEARRGIAAQYRVDCVAQVAELEGKTFFEAYISVKGWQSSEGVVVRLIGGYMVKIKTEWWHKAEQHKYRRWIDEAQRESEKQRRKKKTEKSDVQELRAVVRGWGGDRSPGLLTAISGVRRVEAFYARDSGKRGAVILCFESLEAKAKAQGMSRGRWEFDGIEIENAYSGRSSSNGWHRVRSWYPNDKSRAVGCVSDDDTGWGEEHGSEAGQDDHEEEATLKQDGHEGDGNYMADSDCEEWCEECGSGEYLYWDSGVRRPVALFRTPLCAWR